jgi:hypothetical protein
MFSPQLGPSAAPRSRGVCCIAAEGQTCDQNTTNITKISTLIRINYPVLAAAQPCLRTTSPGDSLGQGAEMSSGRRRRKTEDSEMASASNPGVSRRTLLFAAAAAAPALALGRAEAAALPQAAVSYQDSPKDGKDCKACKLFVAPSSCKTVSGTISPNGWCKLWVKA